MQSLSYLSRSGVLPRVVVSSYRRGSMVAATSIMARRSFAVAVPPSPVDPAQRLAEAKQSAAPQDDRSQLLSDASRKVHFRATAMPHPLYDKPARLQVQPTEIEWDNPIHHEIWSKEEVNSVKVVHTEPSDLVDKIAYAGTKVLRIGFDLFSGYLFGGITTERLLRRIVFLETTAGIPGMVAGAVRHLRSLRIMRRDHGWIHTLLEEAENERMHLLVFKDIKKPGLLLRTFVMGAQGVFWNVFFLAYLTSPRLCHRFVGYIEEEAVKTYTAAIEAYDQGKLPELQSMAVPSIARTYWRLAPDATMRDVLLAVRADEANHRDVNHTFSSLHDDDINPYVLKKKD